MDKPVTLELIICESRFNKIAVGSPFFWKRARGDGRLWMKTSTKVSACCIETGEIKYVRPYTRVEEVVGGL